MPARTLLVGNGPNRLGTDSHSWQQVLLDLAARCGVVDPLKRMKGKPFTLFFEELLLRAPHFGYSEGELRAQVAESMRQLEPGWVHRELMALAGRHVLTTNYEYTLERAAGAGNGNDISFSNETRYSLFRRREVGTRRVWHVHGELDRHDTIILGYDQYVGYLDKARGYLSAQPAASEREYKSPMLQQLHDFEERTDCIHSWVDLFLRDDVHVVGFGFDYSEIDLWWLLSLKQRMRHRDRRVMRGVEVGRTIFYHFQSSPRPSSAKAAHLSALDSFGAECVGIPVRGGRYEEGWERLLGRLAREG